MIQPDRFNLKTSSLILLFVAFNITNCTIDKPKTQQKYRKLETTYYINQKQPEPKLEKTKYEYFNQDGQALRWLEVDTNNNLLLDYIYEYDEDNILVSALYKEESDTTYYKERFSYPNDSTMITEWLDSAGSVYYTMIDNLNKAGKSKRASFVIRMKFMDMTQLITMT